METGKEVARISLNNIIPNRFQPRISFDEQGLNELADSIKMYGILQPLILRPLGDKYEIIAGERRYKAASLAGLTEVPAILVNLDDQTSAELAIIENIQRKDLTAIEEAKSYKKLLDLGNYTQEQLAIKMGKNQSTIANKLRLLNLLPETQEALMNNLISERHARSLLQLKDDTGKQREVLNKITNERLTVKDTDELIKSMMEDIPMNQSNNDILNVNNSDVNVTPETNFSIPNLNTDTFNLSQMSDNNLEISSTPQNYDFNFNGMLNNNPAQEPTTQNVPEFNSLLKEEEQPLQQPIIDETPIVKFDTPPAPNASFPDIEKTPVNMNFNPTFYDEPMNEEMSTNTTKDITKAIYDTKDMVRGLEMNGYKVETDETDYPDYYQITIKINKN